MFYENCHLKLSNLLIKLDENFSSSYQSFPNQVQSQETNNPTSSSTQTSTKRSDHHHYHHIHHHSHPYSYPLWYPSTSTTIINNYPQAQTQSQTQSQQTQSSTKKKEDKDKENDSSKTIGTVAIVSTVAIVGTYLAATDEYTTFTNSDIEEDIGRISLYIAQNMISEPAIIEASVNVQKCFDEWIISFRSRTRPCRNSKALGILSGLSIAGGYNYDSDTIKIIGIAGFVMSGCYLMWNHLTRKMVSEAVLYNNLLNAIIHTQGIIVAKHSEFMAKNYSPNPSNPSNSSDSLYPVEESVTITVNPIPVWDNYPYAS